MARDYDRDRFLLSLSAPPAARAAVWPLLAFNYEIARTREVVTEPMVGLIRLQWWRDAIAGLYAGTVAPHEIVVALAAPIHDYDLPQKFFQDLIDAREADLQGEPFRTLMELEMYADKTSTPLTQLILKVLGQEEDDKTVRALSMGYALTGLLRAQPFHETQGRKLLPRGSEDAVAVTALAEKYLGSVIPAGSHGRRMAHLAGDYLRRIRVLKYNLRHPSLARPSLRALVSLSMMRW